MTKLQEFIDIANKEYDGHFTIFKFTCDWRCCFGTIDDNMKCVFQQLDELKKKLWNG